MTEIAKPEGHKDGEQYTNTVMVPYYDPEELEAALDNKGLRTLHHVVTGNLKVLPPCLPH